MMSREFSPDCPDRKLDVARQKAVIEAYETLNSLDPNEVVLFADAVHPTHDTRPVGCWTAKKDRLAIKQTNGRQRLNIYDAIALKTG
jgi:hypothetical protein